MAANRSLIGGLGHFFSAFLPSARNARRSQRRRVRAKLRTPQFQLLESRVMLSTYWVDDVTVNGNGLSGTPFATISAAAIVAVAGDTINIREGIYRETINPLNSGTTADPITYQAIDGAGTVTIKGTDVIGTAANDWNLTSGQSYYETSAMNWTQGIGNDQIFVNDQMMLWARWPNNTSLNVLAASSGSTWETIDSIVNITDNTDNSKRLTFTDTALNGNAADWVGGYIQLLPGGEWISQSGIVVAGSTGNTLIVDILSRYLLANPNAYTPVAGNHYYLTGKLSALDAEGEWYRDSSSGTLYLNAVSGLDPDTVTVEAKQRDIALNLDGKSNLIFDGIDIFGANITTNSASQDLIFRNMNIKYASHYDLTTVGPWTGATTWSKSGWEFGTTNTGVVLDGTGHLFENSTIQYSAGNGITLKGNNIRIINNTILDTDYMATDAGAIFTAGGSSVANVEIAYNTIDRTGRSGIILRGTKASSIHHNDIAHSMLLTADGGGLYTYMNDGQGTIIAYNTVHDIYAQGSSSSTLTSVGLYLDNGSANYNMHHNVVWNTRYAMILNTFTNAQNHRILQNTLVGDVGAALALGQTGQQNMAGTELRNNILVGSVLFYDPTVLKTGNLQYADKSSIPSNVFTDMINGDFTLPFGSPAGEAGEYTAARPFSFGYTGTAPAAGALDIGQPIFATGKQTGAISPNNDLPGLTVNPGVTLMGAGQYDTLGEGVSYHDIDTTNWINQNYGGTWRPGEGVDATSGQIGYIAGGEWVEYTLNVQMAGTYTLDFQTNGIAGSFVTKIGDGDVFASLGTVNVAASSGIKVWTTPALNVTLQKGVNVLRLEFTTGGYNIYDIRLTSLQQPYSSLTTITASGTTTILPGSYDLGGEGVAYHDITTANSVSTTFRPGEGVDASANLIGYIGNTEYVQYTVNVAQSGTYRLDFLADSKWNPTGTLLMNVLMGAGGDASNFNQVGSVTSTNGTNITYTVSGVVLQAGIQVLKLDLKNTFNLKLLSFTNQQSPYGTLLTVTSTGSTTILAGSYDNGGEGVAYHDSDTTNSLSDTWRPGEAVDASSSQISSINNGEWVEYTINVASSGTYNLEFQTNGNTQGNIDVELGDGGFFSNFGSVTVPVSSSTVWTSPLAMPLQAGEQVLRLRFTQGGFNLYQIKLTNIQQPYVAMPTIAGSGSTTLLPGRYDTGGEGIAYHDTGATNLIAVNFGGTWRTTQGVDATEGQIGYIATGEWVEYTVNVDTAGVYNLAVQSNGAAGSFVVKTGDGISFPTILGTVTVNASTPVIWMEAIPVTLQAGTQVLRLEIVTGGFNLYQIQFTYLNPLQAASVGNYLSANTVTLEQLTPLFTEAKHRWEYAGFDVSVFDDVKLIITDLPDNLLGATYDKTIYIDTNGADWGWFIDPTPRNDSEFIRHGDQGEKGHMDLLTVVFHELGHQLGLEHDNEEYLQDTLKVSVRNTPTIPYVGLKPLQHWAHIAPNKLHTSHIARGNWNRPAL